MLSGSPRQVVSLDGDAQDIGSQNLDLGIRQPLGNPSRGEHPHLVQDDQTQYPNKSIETPDDDSGL